MAELAARCRGDGRIRHVRDERYFAWRHSNPRGTSRFIYSRNGRLDGYMILRAGGMLGRDVIRIVDWPAENDDIGRELLDVALGLSRSANLAIWAASLPDWIRSMLRQAGFEPADTSGNVARTGPGLLVRPIGDSYLPIDAIAGQRFLIDVANWDLRMIDSDGR